MYCIMHTLFRGNMLNQEHAGMDSVNDVIFIALGGKAGSLLCHDPTIAHARYRWLTDCYCYSTAAQARPMQNVSHLLYSMLLLYPPTHLYI